MSTYIYHLVVLFSIVLFGCQTNQKEKDLCTKFIDERYLEEKIDSVMLREATESRDKLLKTFEETPIKNLTHEAYHMQFYSAHGFGKSIKLENKNGRYSITVVCIPNGDWLRECETYDILIKEREWKEFEKMIYEFNFWTEEAFRENREVLDGSLFILEGKRPSAEKCNKKTYQFVGRSSQLYDKIIALCENIIEFENQIAFSYRYDDFE